MHRRRVSRRGEAARIAAEELILEHLPMVRAIAKTVRAGLPAHVEADDLIQDGVCGLIAAARRYNDKKGVPFAAYAKHRIRGAILDGLRRADPATRGARSAVKKFEAAARQLGTELGRQPSDAEVVSRTGLTPPAWAREHLSCLTNGTCHQGTGLSNTAPDELVADEGWRPDVHAGYQEFRTIVSRAVQTLPARYQMMLHLYHWRGLTMKEVGIACGVNESRVSQIHKRAVELLAESLKSEGITTLGSILPGGR